MRVFPLRLLPVLLIFLASASPAFAWWNQNWTKRIKLTFLNGAQAESFTDFPALVRLDSGRIDYRDTQNSGQDIRFVDADDVTPLAYEIESWDESGSSYVWVKVPDVAASSNADFIWMYYGNPVAADAQTPTQVWDNSFEMVLHLRETSGTHFDSTSKNNDSSTVDVTTQGSAAGRINGADVFSGTNNIDVDDAASLNMGATDSFTLEAWIQTSNLGQQVIVSKEGSTGTAQYQLWTDTGIAAFWLHDGTFQVQPQSPSSVANGQWRYLVGRWSDFVGQADLFVDGTLVAGDTNSAVGDLTNPRPLRIGEEGDSDPEGGFNFSGAIDEVRLSRLPRSNNWIRAQHLSMTDQFVSFEAPEPSGVMQIISGSYTGNGTDNRSIYVGFQPDVVIVDMDEIADASPNEAVVRTSTMVGDASKVMDEAIAMDTDRIQSLDPTGFTIGTHATVNQAGRIYRYVAFRAAPGNLKVGSYSGDGVTDGRSITGVGFQPEYVVILPESSFQAVHRSSLMPGDLTHNFEAQGFADMIQALETDGFQVGLDPHVNAGSVTYHYAAFNAAPGQIAVGVYTGNATDNRNITGVGFFPEYVIVNRSAGVPGSGVNSPTHKMASSGVSTDRSSSSTAAWGRRTTSRRSRPTDSRWACTRE